MSQLSVEQRVSMRPAPAERDQRTWTTVSFKLPTEVAAEFAKAIWIGERMTNSTVGAIEAISGEFISTALPAFMEHAQRMQSTDGGWWSWQVLQRDGWQCAWCKSCRDLHAHHILSRAQRPDLKLDVTNGVTLCAKCHRDHHEARD